MISSWAAALGPAVGAQVSVAQLRCPLQCDGGDGSKDPQSMASHLPTAHPSASQYSQPSTGGQWVVPLPPSLSGRGCASGSFWAPPAHSGTGPKGQVAGTPCPQLCLFPSWYPWSCWTLGIPVDRARPAPGVVQSWGGHTGPLPRAAKGAGDPRDRNTPNPVPLCQPCTVRGIRSREIFHPFKGSKDRRGASCHRLRGLPHHPVVGGCSARAVSALCQGAGARLWCQGGGG